MCIKTEKKERIYDINHTKPTKQDFLSGPLSKAGRTPTWKNEILLNLISSTSTHIQLLALQGATPSVK